MRKSGLYTIPIICLCLLGFSGWPQGSRRQEKPASSILSLFTAKKNALAPKEPLFTILKKLNSAKGVFFLFSDESLGQERVIPPANLDAEIEVILSALFRATPISFKKIAPNTYVILRSRELPPGIPVSATSSGFSSAALQQAIRGTVTSADALPLAGVSITVPGSGEGTVTDSRGRFVLLTSGAALRFSYVGYQPKLVVVTDEKPVHVTLEATEEKMREVVVTALGIRKEKGQLGYALSEVKGAVISDVKEINFAHALAGRVAGLEVRSVSGGPGSSAQVTIRGVSGLSGSIQPLYVVNGIPINNYSHGNDGGQFTNAPDFGDGIQNISSDDIESVTVLKGGSASALYGSRAKSGVILVTTKSGKGMEGVSFHSSVLAEQVTDPTDWQYAYGNGANSRKPVHALAAFEAGNMSWGGKLDGTPVVQFDGVERPYTAQKGNVSKFYRTGVTLTNTLSFTKSFDSSSFRLSASHIRNRSFVPYSGLDRYNFNLSATMHVLKKLSIDVRANYGSDRAKNRPVVADGAGNANFQVLFLPTSLDVHTLRPGWSPDGAETAFTNNQFATNPWFAAYRFQNNGTRNRFYGSATARYTFRPDFYLQLRLGQDTYSDAIVRVVPTGTAFYAQALYHISEDSRKVSEKNADLLLHKRWTIGTRWSLTAQGGANLMRSGMTGTIRTGKNFTIPFVYTLDNAQDRTIAPIHTGQEIQSLYGNLELAWKKRFYFNASGRNDWFSTLAPSKDLAIFYPSLSGSFLFSELWKPRWLDRGRVRLGWSNVGSGMDPYQTMLNYGLHRQLLNGRPLGQILNAAVPNGSLQPSRATEWELGAELHLVQNRLLVDFAAYRKQSRDEIISAPASFTSGYSGFVVNLGALQNRGAELQVQAIPLQKGKGTWQTTFTGSVNHNRVTSLAAGQSSLGIATSRTGNGYTQNIVGKAFGQVMAFDYRYAPDGQIVLDPNGIPARGDLKAFGSAFHKYTAGWLNEFGWKRVHVSALLEGKFGGKLFSATDYYGYIFGLHGATLVNREGTFGHNISAMAYYTGLAQNISKLFVYDASFIKLRQVVVGYRFPPAHKSKFVRGLGISLVGRNLLTLMKRTDNIDPEASYGGISQGLELGGTPPTRTFGINLNATF